MQFPPLQHREGLGAGCGVHVNPGPHPPVLSQRQPWLPTMHVEATPSLPEPPSPPGTQLPLPPHIMLKNVKAFASSLPQDPEFVSVVKDTAKEVVASLLPSRS